MTKPNKFNALSRLQKLLEIRRSYFGQYYLRNSLIGIKKHIIGKALHGIPPEAISLPHFFKNIFSTIFEPLILSGIVRRLPEFVQVGSTWIFAQLGASRKGVDQGHNQSKNADFSKNFHGVATVSGAVGERLGKRLFK